ncbi:SDR family oxidoreductase [Catellatospora tritici]|uniref:SDR family oxidoreductase n=1 Tax=Catellatospora tritici TaxID=2851566 RepID=UPI001C2D6455|nr:SDR family oxidoreductase [Catellatospora tritici]MBV1852986.1 SDR family oxidoreductase [Catellatospora tritici]
MQQRLHGKVALVAGATRGAGRAIAVELGRLGATVYATGRTTRAQRSEMNRPETIEDTAELVRAAGGTGIAAQVDHLDPAQVAALVARIDAEQGRLDVLVNDIWGGDHMTEWGKPLWEQPLDGGLRQLRLGLETHIVTSHAALPLLIRRPGGLVVEVTDGTDAYNAKYRGSFFYDLTKVSVSRIAKAQAEELRPHGAAAVVVTPGFLRSEAMLDHFGVTEDNWRDGIAQAAHFVLSETPHFLGRGVAALAADADAARFSGQSLSATDLAREYGLTDLDGSVPDIWRYFADHGDGQEMTGDPTGYR